MKAIDIILANGRKGSVILGDNGVQAIITTGGAVGFGISSTYDEDMLVIYTNRAGETVEESYPAQVDVLVVYTDDALENSPITVKNISAAYFYTSPKGGAVFGNVSIENDSFVKELRSTLLTIDAILSLRKSAIESISWDTSNLAGRKYCGEFVLSDCNDITELNIGGDTSLSNVVTIEKCKNLTSIFLPKAFEESFVKIDNCSSLVSINIPAVDLQLSALPFIENIKLRKSLTLSQESLSSIAEEVLAIIQNSTKSGGTLTTDYQELFDILPSSLPNGWTLVFED